jgi:biotin carboxyl carrier protein
VRREGSDHWQSAELERIGTSGLFLLLIDSHPTELYIERRRGGAAVTIGRHRFEFAVERWRASLANRESTRAGPSGAVQIMAPMTGSIIEVVRGIGETVEAGDVVLVIESMKMNNELRAPAAGEIIEIPVKAGERVAAGALLATIRA